MKHILNKVFIILLFVGPISFAQELDLQKDSSGLDYIIHKGESNGPIIIMIHGYGSNENDLYNLYQYFPSNVNFVCPRAPINMGQNRFSWYNIKFNKDGNHDRDINQAAKSDSLLVKFSKNLKAKYGSDSSKIIFGGFSQGSIMSLKITLEHPEVIDGFIGLSGAPIHKTYNTDNINYRNYAHIKCFYAHGTNDNVLKYEYGLRCKNIIDSHKMDLTFKSYKMGHQVIREELIDVSKWFLSNF